LPDWSCCLPSQNTPDSTGSDDLSKQGPRDWLCQTAGAAAHSGGSAVHAVTSVGATFKWPVRVYWEDTDAGGIVFYANYLKFFERSRTEWLRSMGIEQQRLRESVGGMFVVIETSTHHHRPARLDDQLVVTASLLEMGRASLIIGQQALLKSEQVKCSDEPVPEGKSPNENERSEGPPRASSAPSGGSSLRAANGVGATLLCEGRIRIGWVDAASMRPARIPDSIVSRLRTPT
jgi:acyl-CoA thioester hydrolase